MEKENKIIIAGHIADAIAVERIYGMEFLYGGENCLHLIIVALSSDGIKIGELEPFVRMAIKQNDKLTFKIYDRSEIRKLQREGSIYHLVCCDVSNLLYEASGADEMPTFTKEMIKKWSVEAEANFRAAMSRIASFDNGAKFFIENTDTAVALFMLHQVCELSCRALEIGMCGREKRTHNISQHLKFLRSMMPEIRIIPNDGLFDRGLLEQLDKAYSAVRYESGFSAEGIDIKAVYLLAEEFRNAVEAEMEILLAKADSIATHIPSDTKIPLQLSEFTEQQTCGEEITGILEIITHYLEPQAVYQLGMRTDSDKQDGIFDSSASIARSGVHYDLLVISEVAYPYGLNIQQHITHRCGEGVSVLLLIHGQNEFAKAVSRGNSFFHAIAKSGKLLLGSKIPSKMVATDARRYSAEKLDRSTLNRNTRAEELLRCSGEMIDEGHMVLSISLMSQAVEQACLGLILKYLEYKPNLCRVAHLLNICGMFWPQARLYFPTVLNNDKSMYRRLSEGQSNARYGIDEIDDWSDAWGLYRKTEAFVGDANLLSRNSLVTAENPE
ncbi:HEPN domain-containing protein [Pedobacter xixiisoli]|uniref:HEPN domain-containing protein n=1 Tax=Pedobacter xixiisoli TaxID=1476464 RepID=A0A285ZRH3_9SPHI|nr:HEPN domain-containing protein [Pedobacter xixiisoli]SOD12240.1 HEPN domain-containing protein [Pedobacter xixiisoli]